MRSASAVSVYAGSSHANSEYVAAIKSLYSLQRSKRKYDVRENEQL